jgi:hypothetical protein
MALPALIVSACGGGSGSAVKDSGSVVSSTYSISGQVSGLPVGQQITLLNNGSDRVNVASNGMFSFPTPVTRNGSYSVTVAAQPASGEVCTVSGGSGAGVTAAVTTVTVTCAAETLSIGGTVSGLGTGKQVTLLNNGADATTITADGAFAFAMPVAYDTSYAVTVGTPPTGEVCTVGDGSGAGVIANIAAITVTCTADTVSVSGTVTGLAEGEQVTLLNNGSDATTVTADGAFVFATPLAYDSSFSVTVGTEPTGQTCTVSGGAGTGVTADVDTVAVTCSTATFTVGGTVAGLAAGDQVTLLNNGADPVTIDGNGPFNFPVGTTYDGSFSITVGTQPTGQICTVSGGSGAGVTASIANVSIACATDTFSVGGTIAGLAVGQQVTLLDNGANPTIVTSNGGFTFKTPVAFNGSYSVTVQTQPTGEICTVSDGAASAVIANTTAVTVACSSESFSIGGTVSGLGEALQVTLLNNGADPLTIEANGSFTFNTPLVYNGAYTVTVGTQPTGQACTVTSGSATNITAPVNSVTVTCAPAPGFTISGTMSGLGGNHGSR